MLRMRAVVMTALHLFSAKHSDPPTLIYHSVSGGLIFFLLLFIYLLRFAKYTVYITLFNDKKT